MGLRIALILTLAAALAPSARAVPAEALRARAASPVAYIAWEQARERLAECHWTDYVRLKREHDVAEFRLRRWLSEQRRNMA